jgi:hypothetical protein
MLDILEMSHGLGVNGNVNKRQRKTERVARKVILASAESMTDPVPAADTSPARNGEDDVSLARMADEGAPPSPEIDRNPSASVDLARLPPPSPPVAAATPLGLASVEEVLTPLEQRIRRIEDVLAHLQEQRSGETRVVTHPASPSPPASSPAMPAASASTAALFDMGKRLLGSAAHAVMQAPAPPSGAPPSSVGGRSFWLLWDTWAEARAIVRMFVDPRYHLPWSARVLPLSLVAAIITSYYWMPGTTIPVLGTWLNKAVDLMLAFVLFKWLGHEARRYRQTSPDLPPNLRL